MRPPRGLSMSAMKKNEMDINQWQNEKSFAFSFAMSRRIAHQTGAADGDRRHQNPRFNRDAVPPGRLRIRLRIQHIVHARNDQGGYRRRLSGGAILNRGPQISLEPSG